MVIAETGALFRLAARLMQASIGKTFSDPSVNYKINDFMMLLGRHYQVRDDYVDLVTGDGVTHCDLDQGNYSLPIIHAIAQQNKQGSAQLQSILQARKLNNAMSPDMKKLCLDILEREGSLEYVKGVLEMQIAELFELLAEIEDGTGRKNWIMQLILFKLKLE